MGDDPPYGRWQDRGCTCPKSLATILCGMLHLTLSSCDGYAYISFITGQMSIRMEIMPTSSPPPLSLTWKYVSWPTASVEQWNHTMAWATFMYLDWLVCPCEYYQPHLSRLIVNFTIHRLNHLSEVNRKWFQSPYVATNAFAITSLYGINVSQTIYFFLSFSQSHETVMNKLMVRVSCLAC